MYCPISSGRHAPQRNSDGFLQFYAILTYPYVAYLEFLELGKTPRDGPQLFCIHLVAKNLETLQVLSEDPEKRFPVAEWHEYAAQYWRTKRRQMAKAAELLVEIAVFRLASKAPKKKMHISTTFSPRSTSISYLCDTFRRSVLRFYAAFSDNALAVRMR
uniref:Ras-GEF domain-containing protein n=1 Tax=Steinernema glaseri TaxID=37863 RepID=A0A1I7Z580_9BILA